RLLVIFLFILRMTFFADLAICGRFLAALVIAFLAGFDGRRTTRLLLFLLLFIRSGDGWSRQNRQHTDCGAYRLEVFHLSSLPFYLSVGLTANRGRLRQSVAP